MTNELHSWITLQEASRRSGDSVRTWRWRAKREALHAVRAGRRSLAQKNNGSSGRGRKAWHVQVSIDARLSPSRPRTPDEEQERASLLERYPLHQVERAYCRARWLRAWRRACDRRSDSRVTEQDVADRIVAEARRCEDDGFRISFRALQRWKRAYTTRRHDGPTCGVEALIDRRGVATRYGDPGTEGDVSKLRDPRAVEYFYGHWHTGSRQSVAVCHALAVEESSRQGWTWPQSSSATRKWLSLYDDRSLSCLLREGKDTWCRKYMRFNEIDYTLIEPGQLFQTDHHQCDFFIEQDRKQLRPWLTVVQDMRSRAIVGWNLGPAPHSDAILSAYLMAFRSWAVPERIRIDNGKDFTSRRLTGVTKATRDRLRREHGSDWQNVLRRDASLVDCVDPRFMGVTEELGIETVFAIPYAPWSKGTTERLFGTFEGRCGKTFATYCGRSALTKPECLDVIRRGYTKAQKRTLRKKHGKDWKRVAVLKFVDQSAVPTMDVARTAIAEWIDEYHTTPHTASDMANRTPLDVWHTAETLRRAGDQELLFLMQTVGVYRVGPNGVTCTVGGVRMKYGSGNACLYKHTGHDVLVTVDPNSMDHCHAFTADRNNRRYIGRLDSNRRISPMATVDELREANATVSRRRKVMHQAAREAPARTRTAAEEMAAKRRERVTALRATGTCDVRPVSSVVPVRTGFETATNAVRTATPSPATCDRKSRDLTDAAAALGYGHGLSTRIEDDREHATMDMLVSLPSLEPDSPEDDGELDNGKDAEAPRSDLLSLIAGNRHERTQSE